MSMFVTGLLCLALSLIVAAAPAAKHGDGSAPSAIQAFGSEPWRLVRRADQVSPAVLAALSQRFFPNDRRIADPGAAFNPTDVADPHPRRRLLLAGRTASRWFVVYEVGGRGYHQTLVEYVLTHGRPQLTLLARGTFVEERTRRVELRQITHGLGSPAVRREPISPQSSD